MAAVIHRALHPFNNRLGKAGTADFGGIFSQTGQIVGHDLVGDGGGDTLDDQISGFSPADVAQEHVSGKDQRAGVDLIHAGILGRSAVPTAVRQ